MSNQDAIPLETALRIRDACLCLNVQRAARAVARRFDEAMRPLGLTNGQFSLLVALSRAVPHGLGAVAAMLAMDRTTLTANLKPLERRGLVKVTVAKDDRRGRVLTLTATGRRLLTKALPIWERMHQATESLIAGPDSLRTQLRALS